MSHSPPEIPTAVQYRITGREYQGSLFYTAVWNLYGTSKTVQGSSRSTRSSSLPVRGHHTSAYKLKLGPRGAPQLSRLYTASLCMYMDQGSRHGWPHGHSQTYVSRVVCTSVDQRRTFAEWRGAARSQPRSQPHDSSHGGYMAVMYHGAPRVSAAMASTVALRSRPHLACRPASRP